MHTSGTKEHLPPPIWSKKHPHSQFELGNTTPEVRHYWDIVDGLPDTPATPDAPHLSYTTTPLLPSQPIYRVRATQDNPVIDTQLSKKEGHICTLVTLQCGCQALQDEQFIHEFPCPDHADSVTPGDDGVNE